MSINSKPRSGLIVKQPYADQIINGGKKIEYRSRKVTFAYEKIQIYLLSQCKILGVIIISECRNVDDDEYEWDVLVIHKYKVPRPYAHPNGAQIWVKDVREVVKA